MPVRDRFFLAMAVAQLAVVVAGFTCNALLGSHRPPPITVTVGLHALVMAAWYGLVVVQAILIARRSHRAHVVLGCASIGIAVGVLVTGTLVSLGAARRDADPSEGTAFLLSNLLMLMTFAVLYAAALSMRRRVVVHRGLMLFAGIVMLPPALGRLVTSIGLSGSLILPVLAAFAVAMLVHDLVRSRRVFISTAIGGALAVGVFAGGDAVVGLVRWAAGV